MSYASRRRSAGPHAAASNQSIPMSEISDGAFMPGAVRSSSVGHPAAGRRVSIDSTTSGGHHHERKRRISRDTPDILAQLDMQSVRGASTSFRSQLSLFDANGNLAAQPESAAANLSQSKRNRSVVPINSDTHKDLDFSSEDDETAQMPAADRILGSPRRRRSSHQPVPPLAAGRTEVHSLTQTTNPEPMADLTEVPSFLAQQHAGKPSQGSTTSLPVTVHRSNSRKHDADAAEANRRHSIAAHGAHERPPSSLSAKKSSDDESAGLQRAGRSVHFHDRVKVHALLLGATTSTESGVVTARSDGDTLNEALIGEHSEIAPEISQLGGKDGEVAHGPRRGSVTITTNVSLAKSPSSADVKDNTTAVKGRKRGSIIESLNSAVDQVRRLVATTSFRHQVDASTKDSAHTKMLARLGISFRNTNIEQQAHMAHFQRCESLHTMPKARRETPREWIIMPDSAFRRTWDLCILLLVLYVAVTLPFVTAFSPPTPLAMTVFDRLVDVMFLVDLILNFFTAFLDDQRELQKSKRAIAIRYLSSWFIIDVVSSIPFDLFLRDGGVSNFGRTDGGGGQLQLLSAVKCLRLFRIGRFMRMLNRLHFSNVFGIVKLYGIIVLFAHWLACLWFVVLTADLGVSLDEAIEMEGRIDSWLFASGIADNTVMSQYLACFMTAVLMLFRTTTVGPQTDAERGFYVLAVLIGACIHATIFGKVAALISTMNAQENAFQHNMREIYTRMRYHNLPPGLQKRVHSYFETSWEKYRMEFGENDMLGFTKKLSEPLRQEVQLFMNRDMVEKVPMFSQCDKGVILQVLECLQTHLYMPGDYVVRAGELGDRMFFIRKGQCQVLLPRSTQNQTGGAVSASSETMRGPSDETVSDSESSSSSSSSDSEDDSVNSNETLEQLYHRPMSASPAAADRPAIPGPVYTGELQGASSTDIDAGAKSPESPVRGRAVRTKSMVQKKRSAIKKRLRLESSNMQEEEDLFPVALLDEGDYFGEISLLFRMRRTATICASTYSVLSTLNTANFEKILEANPDFAENIENGFERYFDQNAPTDTSSQPGSEGGTRASTHEEEVMEAKSTVARAIRSSIIKNEAIHRAMSKRGSNLSKWMTEPEDGTAVQPESAVMASPARVDTRPLHPPIRAHVYTSVHSMHGRALSPLSAAQQGQPTRVVSTTITGSMATRHSNGSATSAAAHSAYRSFRDAQAAAAANRATSRNSTASFSHAPSPMAAARASSTMRRSVEASVHHRAAAARAARVTYTQAFGGAVDALGNTNVSTHQLRKPQGPSTLSTRELRDSVGPLQEIPGAEDRMKEVEEAQTVLRARSFRNNNHALASEIYDDALAARRRVRDFGASLE